MKFYLRLSPVRPRFDRYSYIEKAEYWALVWGTVVMSLSGFILWFPVSATNILGTWATPVATVIHYYEAILATLAIVVWHFFFTIFHPDEYPMSMVWMNGRVGEEEIKQHRSEWHERLREEKKLDSEGFDE